MDLKTLNIILFNSKCKLLIGFDKNAKNEEKNAEHKRMDQQISNKKHPEIPKINVSAGYCILLQPTNCLLSIFHFSDFYSTSVLSLARLILSDIWLSALSVLHVINCLRFPFVSHWKHLILFYNNTTSWKWPSNNKRCKNIILIHKLFAS